MSTEQSQDFIAPPGLIHSLLAGFDAVTNHVELVLFPLVLDLFLWMGPHLRLEALIKGITQTFLSLPGMNAPETTDLLRSAREYWAIVAVNFNLFSALRSYPIGIPSLMSPRLFTQTPLGSTGGLDLNSLPAALAAWLLLTALGLVSGTLYFSLVSQASLTGKINWHDVVRQWAWTVFQVVQLAIFWLFVLIAISIPASCLITLMTSLGGIGLGQVGIFLFAGLVIWILYPLLLSPHGIFVGHRKMWVSVREGIRLSRLTVNRTSFLFLIIFVLGEVLNTLWRVPQETSWLTLVGILGHGFVTTSLLAASIIYYRDGVRWVDHILLQARLATVPEDLRKA
jgi:hypothetical protein